MHDELDVDVTYVERLDDATVAADSTGLIHVSNVCPMLSTLF